jgi:hypothetical protein
MKEEIMDTVPWGVSKSPGISKIVSMVNPGTTIAWVNHSLSGASDNARLIAASPTVFMALKTLLALGMPSPCEDTECRQCKRMVEVYDLAHIIIDRVEND